MYTCARRETNKNLFFKAAVDPPLCRSPSLAIPLSTPLFVDPRLCRFPSLAISLSIPLSVDPHFYLKAKTTCPTVFFDRRAPFLKKNFKAKTTCPKKKNFKSRLPPKT
jgi:hypothetical protein